MFQVIRHDAVILMAVVSIMCQHQIRRIPVFQFFEGFDRGVGRKEAVSNSLRMTLSAGPRRKSAAV